MQTLETYMQRIGGGEGVEQRLHLIGQDTEKTVTFRVRVCFYSGLILQPSPHCRSY